MNHMKQVANVLGIELGECFYAVTSSGEVIPDCKISQDGFNTNYSAHDTATLYYLLTGEYTIKKEPWKPNRGDYYFAVFPNGTIRELKMVGDHVDIAFYKTGNCYRTKEEAEAHAEEWKVFF